MIIIIFFFHQIEKLTKQESILLYLVTCKKWLKKKIINSFYESQNAR